MYLALTGSPLKGQELVWCGLATHYVPSDRIEDLKRDLIENVNLSSTDEEIHKIVDSHTQ